MIKGRLLRKKGLSNDLSQKQKQKKVFFKKSHSATLFYLLTMRDEINAKMVTFEENMQWKRPFVEYNIQLWFHVNKNTKIFQNMTVLCQMIGVVI